MQHVCELCNKDVDGERMSATQKNRIVNGRTIWGTWAYMCLGCLHEHGVGLGLGKGQLYDTLTGEKLNG